MNETPENCKKCHYAKQNICNDSDRPNDCRDYWKEVYLRFGCETADGKRCIFSAPPKGKYQPGHCTLIGGYCKEDESNLCSKRRYEGRTQ